MAEQPAIEPMHQFLIHKIVQGPVFHIGGLSVDMSITTRASMIVGAPSGLLRPDREARSCRTAAEQARSALQHHDRVLVG